MAELAKCVCLSVDKSSRGLQWKTVRLFENPIYMQSWWARISKLFISNVLETQQNYGIFVQYFGNLPLLPAFKLFWVNAYSSLTSQGSHNSWISTSKVFFFNLLTSAPESLKKSTKILDMVPCLWNIPGASVLFQIISQLFRWSP